MRACRILIAALGILVHLAAAGSARAEVKIGFINSEDILQEYQGTRTAMDTFNRDVEGWNREATERKRELDELGREISGQAPMLSDEKRREREQDYQRKLTEYDQFVQSIWGPQGLVVKRNEEILRPIVARIQTILARIGSEEGFDLILDAADGNIVYADQALDLTSRVLAELNEEAP